MVLHSFYNGFENILILILIIKNYEGKLPNSNKWHMELLEKAFVPFSILSLVFFENSDYFVIRTQK